MPPKDRDKNDAGTDLRTRRVVIYMTPDDADRLNHLATDLGMKSRSAFITSVLERHLISGFSIVGGIKLCNQIQERFQQRGGETKSFYFGIRPLPALPEERAEVKDIKKTFNKEITQLKEIIC